MNLFRSEEHVRRWLEDQIELCAPAQVVIVDGSPREKAELIARAVADAIARLNQHTFL